MELAPDTDPAVAANARVSKMSLALLSCHMLACHDAWHSLTVEEPAGAELISRRLLFVIFRNDLDWTHKRLDEVRKRFSFGVG